MKHLQKDFVLHNNLKECYGKNKITKEEVGTHIQVQSSVGGGKEAQWDSDTISLSRNTGNKGLGQMIHF